MSQVKLTADSGGGSIAFKAPSSTTSNADVQLTLPVDDGAANTWLKSNGSGVTSWAAPTATEIATSSGTAGSGTFLRGDNTWAAAGGGKLLQVVEATTTTEVSSTSATMADSGLTASITPASGSKVLIFVNQSIRQYRDRNSTNNQGFGVNLLRGSTIILPSKRNDGNLFNDFYLSNDAVNNTLIRHTMNFLDDSPGGDGGTSITYKTQFAVTHTDDSGQVWAQPSWESQNQAPTSSIILMEIGS